MANLLTAQLNGSQNHTRISADTLVRVICLATFASASLGAIGCERSSSAELATAPVPAGGARVLLHRVGTVFLDPSNPDSWSVSHVFAFRNPSKVATATLRVKHMTCGCAKCSIEKADLPPGETTRILLQYNLRYERGSRREGAFITTGLPTESQVDVYLDADIFPVLSLRPTDELHASGPPESSALIDVTLVAYQPIAERRRDLRMRASGSGIKVETAAIDMLEKDGVRRLLLPIRLRVTFPKTESPLFGSGQYVAHARASIGDAFIERKVTWAVPVAIEAKPSQVFISAYANDSVEAVVRLEAEEPFSILSTSAYAGVHADVTTGQKAIHTINIKVVRPPSHDGGTKALIALHTDHPLQRIVQIPVFVLW